MQTIDITLSPAPSPVKDEWNFLEVWIDPMQSPPYLLMLMGDRKGICHICDPVENYRVVQTSKSYEEAQLWLLEDEFEPVRGRLSIEDLGLVHAMLEVKDEEPLSLQEALAVMERS
jgi:RelB Antitoxin alpha helical domain